MINAIRAAIFYTGYSVSLVLYATLCVLIGWLLPIHARYPFCLQWNKFAVWWLGLACGVRYRTTGSDNIPEGPFVLFANHQSPWETLYFTYLFQPICPILKQELLKIPFFGWGLALLKPIAIDRSKRRAARDQLLTQGRDRLDKGFSILIFPEGTRVDPGVEKKYSTGGAELAIAANVPVLPVAHNAGKFWPAHQFRKTPGYIDMVIGKPIDTSGRDARELTEQFRQWVASQQL
jgi:1-acyl-sn-glycerol-3-phosphate acyltransferase